MPTDADFLRKLLDDPADDTARLVYADWLDEQGDDTSRGKAEFLRLTAKLTTPGKRAGWRKARRTELQVLAAGFDTDWLAVVSKLGVENCAGKREKARTTLGRLAFDFVCDQRWDELTPAEDRTVRFCDKCRHNVHYCDTIQEARNHAWMGHCVAVDLGIIRRDRDLEPQLLLAGLPSLNFWEQEEERLRPDPVSEERERRKQEARDGERRDR